MCMPAIAESDWPVGSVVPLLFVPEGELVLLRVEVPVVDLTVVKVVGVGRAVVVVRAVVDGRTLVTVVFPEGVGTADVVAPAPHAVAERAVKVDSSAGQLFTRQAVTASVKTWLLQTQVRSALSHVATPEASEMQSMIHWETSKEGAVPSAVVVLVPSCATTKLERKRTAKMNSFGANIMIAQSES